MRNAKLLTSGARSGARRVARKLLDDAGHWDLEARTADPKDDEGLHDFRVGVRRLRSWLRAVKPELHGAITRKQRRRLAKIAAATSASRDAEVHLAWLAAERQRAATRERTGSDWLREQLESARSGSLRDAMRAARKFEAMRATLERGLRDQQSNNGAPFGVVLAKRVRQERDALRDALAKIEAPGDVAASHRARIAAKHLRYVLEPVSFVRGAETIIETLKGLQDALGNLHDVHVFTDEVTAAAGESAAAQARAASALTTEVRRIGTSTSDPMPGLLRIARRLRKRGLVAFAGIESAWLGKAGNAFFARVGRVADALERAGRGGRA
jgi:CHAD domain-containing protein